VKTEPWIWALDIHKVKVESDKVGFCKLELFSDQMLMPVGRLFFRSTETGTNPQHWIHAIRESGLGERLPAERCFD
jgi:hypothetical protein